MPTRLLVACCLFVAATVCRADVVVLVHGYLGDADSWESRGVTTVLTSHGWRYDGQLSPGTRNFTSVGKGDSGRRGTLYTVNLPSTAPLTHQADLLWALVQKVFDHHPDEPVTLVGHSAGGVVARLALVRFGTRAVETLITIASPHLGTPRALDGLGIIEDSGPFEFVKQLVGGDDYRRIKRSGGTLWDLSPPRPGNLLFWLNAQPHPEIRYVSVLRLPTPDGGDDMVPVPSQDLNQVAALRGRSEVVPTFGDHYLARGDGIILARLLAASGNNP